jgi:hypothetical protein
MANVYVWSGATGAGTGADWANAYTTLDAACTAKAAGDTFFVADDHAQTQATSLTITSPGTEANPCRIYCVRRVGGSVPPVAADLRTTATITTTTTAPMIHAGSVAECNGIIFNCGSGGSSGSNFTMGQTSGRMWRYVNCSFRTACTNTVVRFLPVHCTWENCTVQFGAVGQSIQLASNRIFVWKNTPNALIGAVMPTAVFVIAQAIAFIEGVDFSALVATRNLVNTSTVGGIAVFKNCKLSTTASIITGANGSAGADVQLINCDSGDTNYRNERYNFMGTQFSETTIVRTGGATDGTTSISWRIATTADPEKDAPFEALPIYAWIDTVGSPKTLTLQGIWGGGAVPNNDDIWVDVEYLGTSGFPIVSKVSSGRATPLTAGSAIPAGSGTWGGSTTKFALAVTFTPQEKGLVTAYVKAALPSQTFYIDPRPVIT